MGRCILALVFVFSLSAVTPPVVYAQMLTTSEIVNGRKSLSQRALKNLNEPDKIQQLEKLGISQEEARQRIAGLSDDEIQKILNGQYYEAGGDLVVILLLVIIIVLLVR